MAKRGREPELFEFDNDFLEIKDIAARIGCSYNTAVRFIQTGYTSTDKAKSVFQVGKGRRTPHPSPKRIAIAPLPKPVRVNQNCIVRVRHNELDSLLNYLAKTSKRTYQEAFEAFIIYIYEGHLWRQDTVQVLKERLLSDYESSGVLDDSEFLPAIPEPSPHLRIAELLESYIVSLETKNAELETWKQATLKQLRSLSDD